MHPFGARKDIYRPRYRGRMVACKEARKNMNSGNVVEMQEMSARFRIQKKGEPQACWV